MECRSYRDTAGNTNSSAALWINGGFIGVFGVQYGTPEVLEHYTVTPYLESVGVLADTPRGEYSPHIRNRLKAMGVDYYQTESRGRLKDQWRETELPSQFELWDLLFFRFRKALVP